MTYLTFDGSGLIITVGSGPQGCTKLALSACDAPSFGKVLLTLLLSDLDLLLLTTTTELIRLESVLGLECRPAVLGNVPVRHDEL